MHVARPALEVWFNEHHLGVRHDLGGTMVPADSVRLGQLLYPEAWDVRYAQTAGSPAVRSLIAAVERVSPEDLVLTCGATEAAVCALLAAARPRTVAVLQEPLYYLFEPWLVALGVEIRRWRAGPEGRWDVADAAKLLDPDVSVVVINSPHNPTGQTIAVGALAQLVEQLPEAFVVADEVYRGVSDDQLDCAATRSTRILAVASASKRWGLPGLRLGWIACRDAALRERALAWHEHLAHSPPRPSETALAALWSELQVEAAGNRAIARRNSEIVERWLALHPDRFAGSMPAAGVTMLLAPVACQDDVAFAQGARQRAVFVVPGSTLGYPGRIRIGFGHRDPVALTDALAALAAAADLPHGRSASAWAGLAG